jgi:hypothetical protein
VQSLTHFLKIEVNKLRRTGAYGRRTQVKPENRRIARAFIMFASMLLIRFVVQVFRCKLHANALFGNSLLGRAEIPTAQASL